jgi:cysteine desulfurase
MRTYLDYNATAPLMIPVKTRMMDLLHMPLNGSSMHKQGQQARGIIQSCRHVLADYIQSDAEDIIFTSGGTEANNLALQGVPWDKVFISAVEHNSVYKAHPHATILPVDRHGLLDLNALEDALKNIYGKLNLVSVIWANNETGVIQPLKEIVTLAHQYGALVHTDAIQMIGKCPIRFKDLGLDLMTVSAHKFGGPQGVGALVVKPHVPLSAMMRGGGQEKNRRSGTENILAIAGFAEAIQHAPALEHLRQWHQKMETNISNKMTHVEGFQIIGTETERLPNVTCLTMPGMLSETQVMAFDLENIAISAGAACSSGTVKSSRILQSMGCNPALAQTAIRVSTGWATQPEDLEKFTNTWLSLYDKQNKNLRKATA